MLKIYTTSREFIFHEKVDQDKLLNVISAATANNAALTNPAELSNGETIRLSINNIVAIVTN